MWSQCPRDYQASQYVHGFHRMMKKQLNIQIFILDWALIWEISKIWYSNNDSLQRRRSENPIRTHNMVNPRQIGYNWRRRQNVKRFHFRDKNQAVDKTWDFQFQWTCDTALYNAVMKKGFHLYSFKCFKFLLVFWCLINTNVLVILGHVEEGEEEEENGQKSSRFKWHSWLLPLCHDAKVMTLLCDYRVINWSIKEITRIVIWKKKQQEDL